jgi:hypothetical protein
VGRPYLTQYIHELFAFDAHESHICVFYNASGQRANLGQHRGTSASEADSAMESALAMRWMASFFFLL